MKPALLAPLFVGILATASPLRSADPPAPKAVADAMRKAAEFYHSRLAYRGGYASAWKRDLSEGHTEHKKSKSVISIQPPGTTTVGLVMLRAYEATGEEFYLIAARDAAGALIECQLASGGWTSDFDFEKGDPDRYFLRKNVLKGGTEQRKKRNDSTLDDNKTQSALLFLLELAHVEEARNDEELQASIAYGLDQLLAAQAMAGSWPQQFDAPSPTDGKVNKATLPESWPREWPNEKYQRYHTLNDGNLLRILDVLLRANELTKDDRYLVSARRLGDFLLLTQLPAPQSAWAQQYDEAMQPVWARKFEPPSVSSTESFGAIETLFKIWLATGEDKYRDAIPPALDWLEKSRLPGGEWARFYELKTNQPLYCEAGTYKLTYDDSNLPTHYGFKIESDLSKKIEKMREELIRPREDLLRSRAEPDSTERWAKSARGLVGKVNSALESQRADGYWLDDDLIDAGLFVRHMSAMAQYLKAARNAGGNL